MKNLRKILAMVLVVAMAFSFAAVASAKFTDDSSIKYTTAVGLMTGIGAIDGKPDGSFGPTAPVTRAEAAKMITFAVLGPKLAKMLPAVASSFSDVTTSYWASSYIGYLVAQGVIGGRGDGTFDPNGNVTAIELAKMLLCALGYGKNNEFAGSAWEFNVLSKAFELSVFEDSAATDFSAAATKEEAALYIYNVIMNINKVTYSKLNDAYSSAGTTFAANVYKMATTKGLVTEGAITGALTKGTNVAPATFNSENTKVIAFSAPVKYLFEATTADLGTLVKLFYNTETMDVYYKTTLSTSKASIFGALSGSTSMYPALFGTAKPAIAVYKISGSYTTAAYSGVDTSANNATFLGLNPTALTAGAGTYSFFGNEIISYVTSPATTFEKVTAISTTAGSQAITFSTTGKLTNTTDSDLIKEYDGIAVGDYVVLTKTGTIYTAGKTTTVDGTISKAETPYGASFGVTSITLDGKAYSNSQATGTAGLPELFPSAKTDYTANTYTLYLDEAGAFLTCILKVGTTTSSVVYVSGAEWNAVGDYGAVYKVQTVNSAGEIKVYTCATDPDVVAGFYKVAVNSTTSMATFTPVVDTPAFRTANFVVPATGNAGSGVAALKASTIKDGAVYFFGSDVKFIFVDGYQSTLTVSKVSGLAAVAGITLNATDLIYFNDTTNPNKTISTVIVSAPFIGGTTAKVVYIKSDASPISTNADGTQWNVYVDGVKTAITATNSSITDVDANQAGNQSGAGKFVNYTINDKGFYTFTGINSSASVVTAETIDLNGIFNGQITTASGSAKVAADAIVLDFATSAFDPAIYTSIGAMEAVTNGKTFAVSYQKNTSGEITAMYVTGVTTASVTATITGGVTAHTGGFPGAWTGEATVNPTVAPVGVALTYKWYFNSTNSKAGATEYTSAFGASVTTAHLVDAYINGADRYVYCVITIAGSDISYSTDIVMFDYVAP